MRLSTFLLAPYHALSPTSQGFGETVIGTPGRGRLLALTYDDGPNPRWTPQLLDLLARYGVKATFFVVGKYVEQQPELVQRSLAEGHALGNHTYSHMALLLASEAKIAGELKRCAEAVERAGGRFSRVADAMLCRPPYGRKRPAALARLRALGYVPVMWSVTCWDWARHPRPERVWWHARRQIRGGDIVLQHDGDGDHGFDVDRAATLVVTERILERYGGEGFEFVTVPELVARSQR